jgi:hypothetical protein
MAAQDAAFNKFKFNTNANYYLPTKWEKEINVGDLSKLKIYVNCTDYFQARNINMFTNYILKFFSTKTIDKWLDNCNMSFYQNQLNFAVWCATSGCGVCRTLKF